MGVSVKQYPWENDAGTASLHAGKMREEGKFREVVGG
jgi:hypothetical protein